MPTTAELFKQLEDAKTYEEWVEISKAIDIVENREKWRSEDSSSLYDYRRLHGLLSELRLARLQKNYTKLLYLVRTSLARNVANMGDPRLYTYARGGTKYLVDEFISECELVLHTLANEADSSRGTEVLNTLIQTRKAFGRTALVLSGGSILGFLHVGFVRELVERNLLPRIISGSSAGSIFASVLCTHKDEEFDRMWELLQIPMAIFGPSGQEESLLTHIKRFFVEGTWVDSTYLKEMLQGLLGDVTFQEAYNRTGRILNVSVSVAGSHEMPRLLNYLTAPNVVIWSAIVCSCSVPFVFAADSIFAKNPKTKEIYPWSKRAFIDGSVDNDMPLTRLSEMFNVNHFVACQVNPHVAPLFTSDRGSSDVKDFEDLPLTCRSASPCQHKVEKTSEKGGNGWIPSPILRKLQTGRALLFSELEHGLTIMKAAGISPSIASTMLNVIGQEYWGDITIVPTLRWADMSHLFQNPTVEQIEELANRGRKATWPKLALIRNHCAVELALDKAIVDLRSRVIATEFQFQHSVLRSVPSSTTIASTPSKLASARHRGSITRTKSMMDNNNATNNISTHNHKHNGKSLSVTSLSTYYKPKSVTSADFLRPRNKTDRRRASVDITYETPTQRRASDSQFP